MTKLILVFFLSGDVFISKRTVILRRPRWSCTHAATRSKSTRIQQNVLIPGTLLYVILLAVVCTVNRVVICVVEVLASTFHAGSTFICRENGLVLQGSVA